MINAGVHTVPIHSHTHKPMKLLVEHWAYTEGLSSCWLSDRSSADSQQ